MHFHLFPRARNNLKPGDVRQRDSATSIIRMQVQGRLSEHNFRYTFGRCDVRVDAPTQAFRGGTSGQEKASPPSSSFGSDNCGVLSPRHATTARGQQFAYILVSQPVTKVVTAVKCRDLTAETCLCKLAAYK